jgi:cytoskeletal protein RodZ
MKKSDTSQGAVSGWAVGLIVVVVILVAGVLLMKTKSPTTENTPPTETTAPAETTTEQPATTEETPSPENTAPDAVASTAAGPTPEIIPSTAIGDNPLTLVFTILAIGGAGYAAWNLYLSKRAVRESLLNK